ncbi:MAG: protein-export membrane protein SecF [Candidatus Yanofskybacteria bacterium RIFCSPHIGHO2_02_FULL_38_22b]|uniref:Protein-export membrane protein SecF n=1 Tax=Candidatus Yanofskybacteria bacterium RIFCSPHIGHO2_02_FULL_38_22b TaxID=1802673 RepID=A0A1F8F328_9BACT|nr:MAG: protein-export membrane protein SecF [Candidatus Yanofskybacteria bacterium RIFCSPHIGHO2_01_FULL_39_44]OGN07533.1 MAG: protein-export membrane protein SecF [Candidatus Yanofskybacteria bacterium RIFCSPHIGHO2_02_FULL_38_22b]
MNRIYTIMFFASISLMLAAIVVFAFYGLKFGVDFRGGSILEIEFTNSRPIVNDVQDLLKDNLPLYLFNINESGSNGLVIRTQEITERDHQKILSVLRGKYSEQEVKENRFDSVGPIIGKELKEKSLTAIILALLTIIVYIAFVFRKMSVVLSSWSMSLSAMVALAHDIIIPIGVFALLGHLYNVEISAVFVAALLTILGYSVSDTVVIFDRVRENVIRNRIKDNFGRVVHVSIMQTLTRSLNTTFTTLLSLIAIYIFGGESLKYFSLALIIGIFLGAYSSIFVASPLLVWWSEWAKKPRK